MAVTRVTPRRKWRKCSFAWRQGERSFQPSGNGSKVVSALYLNRELSLVASQSHILEEAQNEQNRLLERLKFLSIIGSNLDEFFLPENSQDLWIGVLR